jgi:hypothetical protein
MHVFVKALYLACIINMKSVSNDSPSVASNGSFTPAVAEKQTTLFKKCFNFIDP